MIENFSQRVAAKPSRARRMGIHFLCVILSVGLIVGVYILSITYRTYRVYSDVKENARGWRVPAHQVDAELGWRPIPLAKSAHVFPIGPDIPMAYSITGLRIPLSEYPSMKQVRPLVLALGCSFTYGDACLAEDAYCYRVAQSVNGTALNAGLCGAGLAQMVILAQHFIPEYMPEFVLVQYSPWLVDRAASHFGPTYYTYTPLPYFAEKEGGGITILPPVFLGKDFDMSHWYSSPRNIRDFFSFFCEIGIPLSLNNDLQISKYYIRSSMGSIRMPSSHADKVIEYSYGLIRDICDDFNASMVIVVLGHSASTVDVPKMIEGIGVPIVNAHEELLKLLPSVNDEIYYGTYGHLRGDPPELVDVHPNPLAHSIIAECILKEIVP